MSSVHHCKVCVWFLFIEKEFPSVKKSSFKKKRTIKISEKNHAFTEKPIVIEETYVFFTYFMMAIFLKDIYLYVFVSGSSILKIRILNEVQKPVCFFATENIDLKFSKRCVGTSILSVSGL